MAAAGYVLGLWPLGSRVLRSLGLYDDFEARSVPLRQFQTAAPNGVVLRSFDPSKIVASLGEIRMINRAALVEVLDMAAREVTRRSGVKATAVTQNDTGVDVTFSDGQEARFDLVLGCDGVNSEIRQMVFGGDAAQPTGWYGWGWWLDPDLFAGDTMTEFWHPGHRFLAIYPAKGVSCAFVGLPAEMLPSEEDRRDLGKLRACFADMGGAVPIALAALDDSRKVFHDAFKTVVTPAWQQGRVALVGDSASAYFPYGGLGIGASMALESAAVLADEMARASAEHLPASLSFYERRRLPRVRRFEETADGVVRLMLKASVIPNGEELLEQQRSHFRLLRGLVEEPI